MKLILASFSRARAELLRSAGYTFAQEPSGIEERPISPGEDPADYVQCLAADKARAVAREHPHAHILAADTLLFLDSKIIGKPADKGDAVRMLCELAGRTHRLLTGICVIAPGGSGESVLRTGVDCARVTMRAMTEEQIRHHVNVAMPLPYAGAYALQKEGVVLIQRMEGDPNTVIGLPMDMVDSFLREAGYREEEGP